MAMYDREVARRVAERTAALAGFDRMTTGDLRRLDERFALDAVVAEAARTLELPVLYTQSAVRDLRPPMTPSVPSATPDVPSFVPRRWLRNGHVMTVYAWGRKRPFPALPSPEARLFRVEPDTRVMAHCYWQSDRQACPTLVALHGLEGSSDAHYMRGLARQGLAARLERRAAQPAQLRRHRTSDARAVSLRPHRGSARRHPRAGRPSIGLTRIGVVGYSLGGNLTMKLAGELGETPDLPVRAVVAVSPTIDLERCVRAIERRANFAYQWNFVRNLRDRMRRKAAAWPGAFDLSPLGSIWTIRKFDDVYTAPHHGFRGATRLLLQGQRDSCDRSRSGFRR